MRQPLFDNIRRSDWLNAAITQPVERCQWQMKRPERVAAVDEGRRLLKAEDIRRAPQQGSKPTIAARKQII